MRGAHAFWICAACLPRPFLSSSRTKVTLSPSLRVWMRRHLEGAGVHEPSFGSVVGADETVALGAVVELQSSRDPHVGKALPVGVRGAGHNGLTRGPGNSYGGKGHLADDGEGRNQCVRARSTADRTGPGHMDHMDGEHKARCLPAVATGQPASDLTFTAISRKRRLAVERRHRFSACIVLMSPIEEADGMPARRARVVRDIRVAHALAGLSNSRASVAALERGVKMADFDYNAEASSSPVGPDRRVDSPSATNALPTLPMPSVSPSKTCRRMLLSGPGSKSTKNASTAPRYAGSTTAPTIRCAEARVPRRRLCRGRARRAPRAAGRDDATTGSQPVSCQPQTSKGVSHGKS